ncbi:DUF4097 family beta strand repeat-containing protein [Nocardia concava]|uniref:DUF4097 family beta strand repeat-containing protein n=1 Tax=Nocardia concava TaxID=257281 RepID=UPI0002FB9AA8|nr:DUF4097 family beta strand repeat-containing protein [Nocardia concava]
MNAFQTPAAITVALDLAVANVTVIASNRTDTTVEVKPTDANKKADVQAVEQTQVSFADNTLSVQTPKGWRTSLKGKSSIEVTVQVPSGSQVNGTVAAGALLGSGPLGYSNVELSLGDITIAQPQGSVTAKVAQGNITIGEAVRGLLELETAVGAIEVGIHPGSAAVLKTNTPNGAVSNQLGPVAQTGDTVEVHAKTSTGNITLHNTTAV